MNCLWEFRCCLRQSADARTAGWYAFWPWPLRTAFPLRFAESEKIIL